MTGWDDEFRIQLESAAEFLTAAYTFEELELIRYLEQYNDIDKLQSTLIGMQSLLAFALNRVAELEGNKTNDIGETALRELGKVMLDFHRYDTRDVE